ncbi:MAG: hypothetical protein FOGNACKC_01058 [Anaerolineae bacterium]|nr:hypothetical protein [Anaerolineae bacterium]
MGNRGILHDDQRQLRYYHRHKAWIICTLENRDKNGELIRRTPMTPGSYTELFFLDEATALAAGHRPCARCNRQRYTEFVHFWRLANPTETGSLDDVLHRDRFAPYQRTWRPKKRTYTAPIDELPPGTFIMLNPDPSARPYLVLEESLLPWSFGGYGQPSARRTGAEVIVLTPRSTVAALAAGYRPHIFR